MSNSQASVAHEGSDATPSVEAMFSEDAFSRFLEKMEIVNKIAESITFEPYAENPGDTNEISAQETESGSIENIEVESFRVPRSMRPLFAVPVPHGEFGDSPALEIRDTAANGTMTAGVLTPELEELERLRDMEKNLAGVMEELRRLLHLEQKSGLLDSAMKKIKTFKQEMEQQTNENGQLHEEIKTLKTREAETLKAQETYKQELEKQNQALLHQIEELKTREAETLKAQETYKQGHEEKLKNLNQQIEELKTREAEALKAQETNKQELQKQNQALLHQIGELKTREAETLKAQETYKQELEEKLKNLNQQIEELKTREAEALKAQETNKQELEKQNQALLHQIEELKTREAEILKAQETNKQELQKQNQALLYQIEELKTREAEILKAQETYKQELEKQNQALLHQIEELKTRVAEALKAQETYKQELQKQNQALLHQIEELKTREAETLKAQETYKQELQKQNQALLHQIEGLMTREAEALKAQETDKQELEEKLKNLNQQIEELKARETETQQHYEVDRENVLLLERIGALECQLQLLNPHGDSIALSTDPRAIQSKLKPKAEGIHVQSPNSSVIKDERDMQIEILQARVTRIELLEQAIDSVVETFDGIATRFYQQQDQEISSLQQLFSEARDEIRRLEKDLRPINEHEKQIADKVNSLTKTLAQTDDEIERREKDHARLKHDLDEQQRASLRLSEDLEKAKMIERDTERAKDKESQIKILENDIITKQKELERLEEVNKHLESQMQHEAAVEGQRTVVGIPEDAVEYWNQIFGIYRHLEETNEENNISVLVKKKSYWEMQVILESVLQKIGQQHESLQAKKFRLDSSIQKMTKHQEGLKTNQLKLKKTIEGFSEIRELNADITLRQNSIRALYQERMRLEALIRQFEEHVAQKEYHDELSRRIEALENTNELLNKELGWHRNNLEVLKGRVQHMADLEQVKSKLERDIIDIEDEIDQMDTSKCETLVNDVVRLRNEYDDLRDRRAEKLSRVLAQIDESHTTASALVGHTFSSIHSSGDEGYLGTAVVLGDRLNRLQQEHTELQMRLHAAESLSSQRLTDSQMKISKLREEHEAAQRHMAERMQKLCHVTEERRNEARSRQMPTTDLDERSTLPSRQRDEPLGRIEPERTIPYSQRGKLTLMKDLVLEIMGPSNYFWPSS